MTGGIGSGKSAVCNLFGKFRVPVLTADDIARELTDSEPEIKKRIRGTFGSEVFTKDGQLDRKKMAQIVFGSKWKKEKLNAIVHPFVLKRIKEETQRLEKIDSVPFVIHEAALIYEAGADKDLDYVIVVDADEETRIRRVMKRDGVSRSEVLRRIDSQMPAGGKKERADFVIRNDNDLQSLEEKVKLFYHLFLKISKTATS